MTGNNPFLILWCFWTRNFYKVGGQGTDTILKSYWNKFSWCMNNLGSSSFSSFSFCPAPKCCSPHSMRPAFQLAGYRGEDEHSNVLSKLQDSKDRVKVKGSARSSEKYDYVKMSVTDEDLRVFQALVPWSRHQEMIRGVAYGSILWTHTELLFPFHFLLSPPPHSSLFFAAASGWKSHKASFRTSSVVIVQPGTLCWLSCGVTLARPWLSVEDSSSLQLTRSVACYHIYKRASLKTVVFINCL